MVDYDAVPLLVQLLMHANADIREQCAWCLGNIAGDSSALRDVVLQVRDTSPLSYAAKLALTLLVLSFVLFPCAPPPPCPRQHGAIASIARNIENPASLSLLRNCTWTMSNLCRGKPAAPLSLVRLMAHGLT